MLVLGINEAGTPNDWRLAASWRGRGWAWWNTVDLGLGRSFSSLTVAQGVMNQYSHRFPQSALAQFLKVASTFSDEEIQECVRQVMEDPEQLAWFKAINDTLIPMSLRKTGLDNDLEQLASLPHYPLEEITAPTLVMHSPRDGDVPFANAQFSVETIPNAELFTVDAGGHFLWLGEDGKQVVERRGAFLKQHAPVV